MVKENLNIIQHRQAINPTYYFDNPDLRIKILYNLFSEKYNMKLKMNYVTYFKYFKQHCHFGSEQPKTDICDYCMSTKRKLHINPNEPYKLAYAIRNKKVLGYTDFRKKIYQ